MADSRERPSKDILVQEFSALGQRFLECRRAHRWDWLRDEYYQDGGWDEIHKCERCETTRIVEYEPSGYPARYQYQGRPEGYSIKGLGQFNADMFAALNLARKEAHKKSSGKK